MMTQVHLTATKDAIQTIEILLDKIESWKMLFKY